MSFFQKINNPYKDIIESFGLSVQEAEEIDSLDGKNDNKYNGKSLFEVINEQKINYDKHLTNKIKTFFDYVKTNLKSDPKTIEIQEQKYNEENNKIAKELVKEIFKIGFTDLKEPISKINEDNVIEVLNNYQKIADKFNLYLDNETLFEAILDEKIPDKEKKEHINHIKNALIKRAQKLSGDTSIIQKHFSEAIDTALEKAWPFQNANTLNSLYNNFVEVIEQMETLKTANTKDCDDSKINVNCDYSNGYFDKMSFQMAGNCWIHAGINNMLQNPKGKQIINNLIYKNQENGSVTVYLPEAAEAGLPKPEGDGMYTYSDYELVKASKTTSMGDGDYTAFVLAIQNFRAENKNDQEDGGTFNDFCKIVFGKNSYTAIINDPAPSGINKKNILTKTKLIKENLLKLENIDDKTREQYKKELQKINCEIDLFEISEIKDNNERYNIIKETFNNPNRILFANAKQETNINGVFDDGKIFKTIDRHAYTILEMNEDSVVLEESNNPGKRITYTPENFIKVFSIYALPLEYN